MSPECSCHIVCKESPLKPDEAWLIESFLVRYFEFGNYSFRQALRGLYHPNLKCVFYLAYNKETIIGAAGALFSDKQPYAAILSPVYVDSDYERQNIATKLCQTLIDNLKQQNVRKIYLGITQGHPARKFYEKLGFTELTGVVMCKDMSGQDVSSPEKNGQVLLKNIGWDDYAEVLALMCSPSPLYTVDYSQGIFSTRYEPMQRFLPVFPEIMRRIKLYGGCAKAIQMCSSSKIVGVAQIFKEKSALQNHLASLDIFVEEEYLSYAKKLLLHTIEDYSKQYQSDIVIWIPECDELKKEILLNIGASKKASLPAQIVINQQQYATELYQIRGSL